MATFSFTVEGVTMDIVPSTHALLRMKQRNIQLFAAYGSIVALGDRILDMKRGDEFCIMDKELGISVCCGIQYEGMDITVYITTVLDSDKFYVKNGVQVYELTM